MPVFMIFKTVDGSVLYSGTYDSYQEAETVVKDLLLKKQAGEDYFISAGYRYGQG